jgi:CheY-like chemotaxis protein
VLSEDGEHVVFAVRDTGIGIALEDREMIFEEFMQVPSALQRRVKGTGLGLPLCRKLATLLGGEVYVESEPGKGSAFFARLRVEYHGEAEAPQSRRASYEITPPEGDWVLVIDDDDSTRMVMEKYLKGTRFGTLAVSTLAGAQEILKKHRPSAVILDILLPSEEQRTWRWLAETKAAADAIPVIVASDSRDARKALSLGADAYFDKPLRREDLLEALERLVGGATRRASRSSSTTTRRRAT